MAFRIIQAYQRLTGASALACVVVSSEPLGVNGSEAVWIGKEGFRGGTSRRVVDVLSATLRAARRPARPHPSAWLRATSVDPLTFTAMLDWYAQSMKRADKIVAFTAAFGVNKAFLPIIAKNQKKTLRFLFLDTWGNNAAGVAATKKAVAATAFNQVAVGNFLGNDVLEEYLHERWLVERSNPLSNHVRYTHTKYMLVDPLGDDPIVITGSANFSDASTTNNDENMLVIRGDTRVADIYLGEFMRLWQHYKFRDIVPEASTSPNYLAPDASWTDGFYESSSPKYAKRIYFAQ